MNEKDETCALQRTISSGAIGFRDGNGGLSREDIKAKRDVENIPLVYSMPLFAEAVNLFA
jgi:hypothetical protein